MSFNKILIANRGEIANRILKTLKRLNIESVALYHELEKDASYLNIADEKYSLGSGGLSDTFLNIDKIIKIAATLGCDGIHPGYGFLSENSNFAIACKNSGINFIGPGPDVILLMGNKTKANSFVEKMGIPVIPYLKGTHTDIMQRITDDFFPCMIKASAGGGGKAMYVCRNFENLEALLTKASKEAIRYFGFGEVYVEKVIENPRHIEVQLLADKHRNVIHLYDRECSIQRRFQKIIEEAPAEDLMEELRNNLFRDSVEIAKKSGYIGAGTIEFLIDQKGNYYFLEMNTRIQVEHPVTEMVTDIDIVEEQIAIAAGENIIERLPEINIKGHAIELRVYAEDTENNYQPSPGIIDLISFPEKPYLRVDTDINTNSMVYPEFDPMIAKIIVFGNNRDQAILRLQDILKDIHIHGIKTNINQLAFLISDKEFINNQISTSFLNEKSFLNNTKFKEFTNESVHLLGTALWLSLYKMPLHENSRHINEIAHFIGGWRIHKFIRIRLDDMETEVYLKRYEHQYIKYSINASIFELAIKELSDNYILTTLNGKLLKVYFSWKHTANTLSISSDSAVHEFIITEQDLNYKINKGKITDEDFKPEVKAPLTGRVIKLLAKKGDLLPKGDPVLVIESMKMENEINMPVRGIIDEILISEGDLTVEGNLIFRLKAEN